MLVEFLVRHFLLCSNVRWKIRQTCLREACSYSSRFHSKWRGDFFLANNDNASMTDLCSSLHYHYSRVLKSLYIYLQSVRPHNAGSIPWRTKISLPEKSWPCSIIVSGAGFVARGGQGIGKDQGTSNLYFWVWRWVPEPALAHAKICDCSIADRMFWLVSIRTLDIKAYRVSNSLVFTYSEG